MTRLSATNTRWRDRYARTWAWALPVAVAVHVIAFLFLPRGIADRIHEALIPDPTVLVRPGATGPLESVELRSVSIESLAPPPEPEEEEVVEEPVPTETAEETITIAEVESTPSESAGTPEGVEGGQGTQAAGPAGGGGRAGPPRPVHLVIPRLPDGIDKKRARGESVHLLVQVLPDGTVGEVRVEKGSRIEKLNQAALAAARRTLYEAPQTAMWTRAEMRF